MMDTRKILWIDPHGKGPNWPVKPVWHSVEYVRKDIHDAAVSKARVDALKEVMDRVKAFSKNHDCGCNPCHGHDEYHMAIDAVCDEILALIEKEPKP